MTTTAPTDAVERYSQLDEPTAALVAAAYGTDPLVGTDHDLDRLDAVITAVTAGVNEAHRMTAQATPETPAEQAAPTLPDEPPVDTSFLRARIGAMDEQTRALFLTAWQASGFPTVLADADGASLVLDADGYRDVEVLICAHEPAADSATYAAVKDRIAALPSGPRFVVVDRARLHGIPNVHKADDMTAGRLATLDRIIDAVIAESTDEVAQALGPVHVGQVVTDPVADTAALASVPPDSKVGDVLAWVDNDPARAALALNAEERRAKPRASLIAKLAQVAGLEVPPASTAAPAQAGGGDDGLASSWVPSSPPDATLSGLALADRLVGVADELYVIATAIVEGQAVS